MIDELDLAFEEHDDRGRHRHRRSAQRKRKNRKKKRRGRSLLALFIVLLLLGGLAGGVWYGFDRIQGFFTTPDYTTAGTGEVTIVIEQGETLTQIANTLFDAGVVKSARAFIEAADANPRSQNIQAGTYKVRKQMRASDALAMLLDTKNKIVNRFTIPEGRTAIQTYKELAKATGIKYEQFVAAAKDPIKLGVPEFWFTRHDGKPVTKSIEGFLFPASYELGPGLTAEAILKQMVAQFITVATELKFVETVERERGGIAPYEALIVASLAQAEAGVPGDLGKVARVAYNRVYSDSFPCNCLGFDVTVNYWFELNGKPTKTSGQMTQAELDDPKNPYARNKRGLPPTPINNPGKAALQGSMAPPPGKWLYFVAIDTKGNSAFAVTDAEHQANIRKACANGVPLDC